MLTERQSQILHTLIEEYIDTALPVSSDAIFRTGFFGISCPTIRNEMAYLTEQGYLVQPHTSAGRIPTQRGYRFFVDALMTDLPADRQAGLEETALSKVFAHNTTAQFIAEEVARQISDLVIFTDSNGRIRYMGLKNVLANPEFENKSTILSLIEELEHFERRVPRVLADIEEEIAVFIGNENPFFKHDEYSVIASRFNKQLMALVGPMRMDYRKNLEILTRYGK